MLQPIFSYSNHIISQKTRVDCVSQYVLYKYNSTTHSCILNAVIDMTAKTPACNHTLWKVYASYFVENKYRRHKDFF